MKATITLEKKSGKWVKRKVDFSTFVYSETQQQRLERARAAYVKKYGEPKVGERIVSIEV